MDRRTFLNILGLLTGSTALSACTSEKGRHRLISALVPPEDGVAPGQSVWHATSCTECPAGCGMLVRLREGLPVKAEGLPGHPISAGGLCMRGQASLWRLYHPERLTTPLLRDGGGHRAIGWEEAFARIGKALDAARGGGRRSAWLSGRTTGALAELVDESAAALGLERLPEFEPFSHAAVRRAHGILFERPEVPRYDLRGTDALLTVGADVLETFLDPVGFAAQLADGRRAWWHAEPHYSLTGANADRRLRIRPGSEPQLLAWLLGAFAGKGRRPLPAGVVAALPGVARGDASKATGIPAEQLDELAAALAKGRSPLVIAGAVGAGGEGALATAGLAALLNWTLGAVGSTVDFERAPGFGRVGSLEELRGLGERLGRSEIGVLFVARADPVRHAPAGGSFAKQLQGASLRVGLGDLMDATLREMDLVLPLAHALEAWDAVEPRRGLLELLAPAIQPAGEARSIGDILLELRRRRGEPVAPSYRERLADALQARYGEAGRAELAKRGYREDAPPAAKVALDAAAAAGLLRDLRLPPVQPLPALVVAPSIRGFDGRSRALRLMEEVPDPLTTVSYGPWLSVSISDAKALGLADGDELRVSVGAWSAELPARLQPGLAAGVFTVQRDVLDRFPGGADPATGEAICTLHGVRVERTGRKGRMPFLAGSPSQHGRGLIPDPVHRRELAKRVSLYPDHDHPEHRWGMVIDVDRCIGCGACTAACYVENNVPASSASEHLTGREMSWLRIEPFYDDAGDVDFLPMLCQHCDFAPCEPVCPVYAAYHNAEGLNVQVYNRCIGTRYCSNNCPYKVRRFNWYDHVAPAPLDRLRNPDLSVRTRGMMEKCTFCVQRIRAAKDVAREEGRAVRDGDVVTACQQSCPTKAILFGDLRDPASRVSARQKDAGSWRVFEALGTEPAVRYLRRPHGGGEG